MHPQRDDDSSTPATEDADPAILVGAFGDERVGLDAQPDTGDPEDAADATAQADPAAPPAALHAHREPGHGGARDELAAFPVAEGADPAILVGAFGDERVGLEPDAPEDDDD